MKPLFHAARNSGANLILILLVSLAAARSSAATLTVTTTTDSGAGSLRAAIALAKSGDTITFSSGLSGQAIHLTSGELLLGANLTIDASTVSGGMTINAGQNSRILEIAGGNAVLNYLTFTNGSAVFAPGSFGGGICVDFGATATLNKCTISSNTAVGGGGLYNAGTATLNACTLYDNYSSSVGGGIENTNSLALNNCTLANNSTTNFGGALYAIGTETLNNCTICSNSAGLSTGGIYKLLGGPLLLTNTIVSGNFNRDLLGTYSGPNNLVSYFAWPGLAPLGNYGGPTQTMPPLFGSPPIDNGTDAVTNFLSTDQRGLPRQVGAHVDIGAAEYQSINLVVTNLDIPIAGTLRYAAMYAAPGSVITFDPSLSGQTIALTGGPGLEFTRNLIVDASSLPGGILIQGQTGPRVLEISNNVNVILNSVSVTDGSADVEVDVGASLILSNSTVSHAAGEGVFNQGFFTAYDCVFSADSSAILNSFNATNVVKNSTFTSVSLAIGNSGTTIVNNSTFSSNSPTTGALIQNPGELTLNNCTIADNTGTAPAILEIFSSSSAVFLNNCTVVGNSGGGISNTTPTALGFFLTNTIVSGNGNFDLGAIYDGANNFIGGNPELAPLANYGGLTQTMRPMLGSPVIGGGANSVTNFLATDQRGYPRLFGNRVDIGAVELENVIVVNTNDSGPGSLRSAITSSVDAVTFNSSLSGKAIYLTNGELLLSGNLLIDASALSGGMVINAAGKSRVLEIAGNVALNYLTLTNGVVTTNMGGGILVDYGATGTLNECTICSNVAVQGGGLFNAGTATLNACTLFGNRAINVGGGIMNTNSLAMNNCTLAENFGFAAGALYALGSETLNNCTISSNSANPNPGGIFKSGVGPLFLTNTIVYGNLNVDIDGPYSGANNLVSVPNPLLAPLGNYGGPTQTMPPFVAPPVAGSPIIDAGADSVTNFLSTDQRGLPRLVGAHVDIGAAEFQDVNSVLTALDESYPYPIFGSLRYALSYAAPGSVITFDPSLSGQTIQLATFQKLEITKNLTIDASSLPGGIRIDGQPGFLMLEISNNVDAVLNSVTLTNAGYEVQVDTNASLILSNSAVCGTPQVGVFNEGSFMAYNCVFSYDGVALENSPLNPNITAVINNSTFTADSQAIGNFGTAIVNNSTFSSNSAAGGGGVVQNDYQLTLNNCTFANNSGCAVFESSYLSGATALNNCTVVGNTGGGISNSAYTPFVGGLFLTNTIVTGNGGFDVAALYDGANNFIGGDPQLAPLGNYGGPTQTMPPLFFSQVIDSGVDSVAYFLTTDQRGFPRLSGDHMDIGAVEAQTANNSPVLRNAVRLSNGGTNSFQFTFTNVANADFTTLTSSNAALPLDQWTILGNATQITPGQYQFTDPSATNTAQFYILISP